MTIFFALCDCKLNLPVKKIKSYCYLQLLISAVWKLLREVPIQRYNGERSVGAKANFFEIIQILIGHLGSQGGTRGIKALPPTL